MSEINKVSIKNTQLSRQDLLEISQNISLYYAPAISSTDKLVLLPIDPLHLYAYWNINENKESMSTAKTERDEVLRIYSQELSEDEIQCKSIVNFPIQSFKSKQIISLPVSLTRKTYFASIGELTEDKEFIPILTSESTGYLQEQKAVDELSDESVELDKKWGSVIENILSISTSQKPSHHVKTNFSGIGMNV